MCAQACVPFGEGLPGRAGDAGPSHPLVLCRNSLSGVRTHLPGFLARPVQPLLDSLVRIRAILSVAARLALENYGLDSAPRLCLPGVQCSEALQFRSRAWGLQAVLCQGPGHTVTFSAITAMALQSH